MKDFFYRIAYSIIRIIGILPLRLLYIISDLMYVLVFYIIRYRRDVVFINIRNSFPEKSTREVRNTAKKFYRNLCDLVIETVHQTGMDEQEIKKRVKYNNPELIQEYYDRGKDVAAVLGHYCNWEWMCGFPIITPYKCITIYKPLTNKVFDNFMLEMRSRFGADLVPMQAAIRKIYEYKKQGIPSITAFISDQAPAQGNSMLWVEFLNQDTAVYPGVERIAKKMDMAVVFFKMKKVKRGYYEFDFIPLFDSTSDVNDQEITKAHVSMLEYQIREQPEHWLWSHRRWKLKRS